MKTLRRPRRAPRARIHTTRRARFLGFHYGRNPVYRFPVRIRQSWLDRDLEEREAWVDVIATDLIRDEIAPHLERPTQVEVVGPEGGVAAHRFIGWESMIGHGLMRARPLWRQMPLPFAP